MSSSILEKINLVKSDIIELEKARSPKSEKWRLEDE